MSSPDEFTSLTHVGSDNRLRTMEATIHDNSIMKWLLEKTHSVEMVPLPGSHLIFYSLNWRNPELQVEVGMVSEWSFDLDLAQSVE